MKTEFYDRHEHIEYLKACEIARRIMENPAIVEDARRWLEEVMAPDPHQAKYVAIWRELLACPPADIASALLEDSERGQLLRETRPIFGKGLTSREVTKLMEQAGLLC